MVVLILPVIIVSIVFSIPSSANQRPVIAPTWPLASDGKVALSCARTLQVVGWRGPNKVG